MLWRFIERLNGSSGKSPDAEHRRDPRPTTRPMAPGFPQLVPDHRDPLRLAVDVDGHALSSSAVDDPASLEAISVRRERLVRITEVDAGLAAPSDAVVANEIDRITVTQGHAMVEVLDQVPLV